MCHSYVCEYHRSLLYSMNSMRAKRKRKDSEEESDYQFEVHEKSQSVSIQRTWDSSSMKSVMSLVYDMGLLAAKFPSQNTWCSQRAWACP